MNILLNSIVAATLCFTTQIASAHNPEGPEPLTPQDCNENSTLAIEGVWRINSTGGQSMEAGRFIAIARTSTKVNIVGGNHFSEFAVTGGGFGEVTNTPLIFLGACDPATGVYTVSGQIERPDGIFQASITQHIGEVTDKDDVCDNLGTNATDIGKCKEYARKGQTDHIAIILEPASDEAANNFFNIEDVTKRILDEGNGHTHGGGGNNKTR